MTNQICLISVTDSELVDNKVLTSDIQ